MVLRGGYVLLNGQFQRRDIEIRDGKITRIDDCIRGNYEIDVMDCYISLGFVDTAVHLKEPGFEKYKEGILSGTSAAARGGFTHVFAMPDVNPVPDCLDALNVQYKLIKEKAVTKVIPYAAITKGLEGKRISPLEDLSDYVCGYTDGIYGIESNEIMRQVLEISKLYNKPLCAVCEDRNYHKLDPAREFEQISRDINLVKEIGGNYHVLHLSTKQAVAAIRKAKKDGYKVTCGITPQHLLFDSNKIQFNPVFKTDPPLKESEHVVACLDALLDDTIDVLVSNHNPHTIEEKKGNDFSDSPDGIAGLETIFGIMNHYFVKPGFLSLERLCTLLSTNPRRIYGFNNIEIKIGGIADLVVMDLDHRYIIDSSEFSTKSKLSPFDGWEASGRIYMTIIDGNPIYYAEDERRNRIQ